MKLRTVHSRCSRGLAGTYTLAGLCRVMKRVVTSYMYGGVYRGCLLVVTWGTNIFAEN